MISAALMLFANTLLFSLRLDRSGSFPRPLSASEERMWLERLAQGDPDCEEDVFQNANLSREKVTEAVCPSLK